jgi:hypothetical protein
MVSRYWSTKKCTIKDLTGFVTVANVGRLITNGSLINENNLDIGLPFRNVIFSCINQCQDGLFIYLSVPSEGGCCD